MTFIEIQEELREVIAKDERSNATIAKKAGIHVSTFSAFVNKRRVVSVETIERLMTAMGGKLVLVKRK